MIVRYNPGLRQRARELRKQGVLSEVMLWNQLKRRKICGYQFMRQKPIGNFIVDFYCSKLQLVIEVDGESHIGRYEYDFMRQKFLESLGLTVLRFSDEEVRNNLAGVLSEIEAVTTDR